MLLTLTALRVIFRVIRVLFWETAWHTHWPGNHTWILPTKLNMFLLSLCLKTVFFKDRGMKSWSPIFFSCIIAQKKPKIQTDCGKWPWRIIKKDFWWIEMFSVNFSSSVRGLRLRSHGTVLISDGTPYLTQHAAPKRKDSALFLWQWPMTNGEKVSMEHKHYSRGRANRLRSRSLVRHATLLVGRKSCVTK